MVREAEFRVQQLQGAANKLACPQSCWKYGGYSCSISSETLHRAWKGIPAALFSAIPTALGLKKGENFNYCSFCIKQAPDIESVSSAWSCTWHKGFQCCSPVWERGGRWWLFWKHFGGGNTLSALSEGGGWGKADRSCLALKIPHGIYSLCLWHTQIEGVVVIFSDFCPCTHAFHRITQKEILF